MGIGVHDYCGGGSGADTVTKALAARCSIASDGPPRVVALVLATFSASGLGGRKRKRLYCCLTGECEKRPESLTVRLLVCITSHLDFNLSSPLWQCLPKPYCLCCDAFRCCISLQLRITQKYRDKWALCRADAGGG